MDFGTVEVEKADLADLGRPAPSACSATAPATGWAWPTCAPTGCTWSPPLPPRRAAVRAMSRPAPTPGPEHASADHAGRVARRGDRRARRPAPTPGRARGRLGLRRARRPRSSGPSPGRRRCVASPCATTCSSSRSSTRASWPCPTSVPVVLVDPETGHRCEVWTSSPRLREQYAALAAAHRAAVAAGGPRRRGRTTSCSRTDRDWVADLARFVSQQRRPRHGARPSRGSSMTLPLPVVAAAARAGGRSWPSSTSSSSASQPVRRPLRLPADARAAGPAPPRLAPPRCRPSLMLLRLRACSPWRPPARDGRPGPPRTRHRASSRSTSRSR